MGNFFDVEFMNNSCFTPLNLVETKTDIGNETVDTASTPISSNDSEKTLEEKLKEISNRLEDLRNLQLLNQLDIINLKNQIEQSKLVTTGMSPEDEARLKRLIELSQGGKELDKIRKVSIELQNLKEIIEKKDMGSPKTSSDKIKKEIFEIESRLARLELKPSIKQASPQKDVAIDEKKEIINIQTSLEGLSRRINALETSPIKSKELQLPKIFVKTPQEKMTVQSLVSEMASIKRYLDILTKRVDLLKPSTLSDSATEVVPQNFKTKLDELNRKINSLSKKPLKPINIKSGKLPKGDIDNVIEEIDKMHDEIDHALKVTKMGEIEKMIKRNINVENRLKKLVSEIQGIELIHPLKEYKKEVDPDIKKRIGSLENKLKNVLEKSKPLGEREKISHMEKRIKRLEEEILLFKGKLKEQKLIRKKMIKEIRHKVIKLSKTY